jgi:hypothetical protein
MKLERIITLANRNVRLQFVAMERSLRAVGCALPLAVIPYDEQRFELPANATWWELPEVLGWLAAEKTHPMMRKYQCLLTANYQFADSDIIFLRNPAEVLQPHAGFVTSCCHWRDGGHTTTEESRRVMAARSTTWRKATFNAGQFACDRALYTLEALQGTAQKFAATCLRPPCNDQTGMNLLVHEAGIAVTNLTLPPHNMESTWAGDYAGEYAQFWSDERRKPYLIHWAGVDRNAQQPIDRLFRDFLSAKEKEEWDARNLGKKSPGTPLRGVARRVKRALKRLAGR